jgi:uracil-DNA glycosylase
MPRSIGRVIEGRAVKRETKLDAHCRALVACRACSLSPDIVPIVSRATSPKVMLVGQAPGKVEAVGGRPFAGRAGKTLFRWLERAGIDEATARRRIYIAAVTRCYPGPSPSGRGDRVPSNREQDACAKWLDAELEIIRPPLLIPVGRLAMLRFLPNLPLDQLIGRAHEVEHRGGRAIAVPLPHPSGASSWIHQGDHPKLLDSALALIHEELVRLGVVSSGKRSVA